MYAGDSDLVRSLGGGGDVVEPFGSNCHWMRGGRANGIVSLPSIAGVDASTCVTALLVGSSLLAAILADAEDEVGTSSKGCGSSNAMTNAWSKRYSGRSIPSRMPVIHTISSLSREVSILVFATRVMVSRKFLLTTEK